MKQIFIVVSVIALIAITWYARSHVTHTSDTQAVIPTHETDTTSYINATPDSIVVELPFPGAVTGKTFSVIGKARGTWFFEASFPIVVLDTNGKVLAQTNAKAQGDWMTTEFVPFKADIKVPDTYIGKATLILKKDNPSGISEKDASISFPFTIEY